MNRRIKERVKKFLVSLLVLTIVLCPITPTLIYASTSQQNDSSVSISQRLSDDEMKGIVGGKKVVEWVKVIFPCKVKGEIKKIPVNTATLKVVGTSFTSVVTGTWFTWDPKTSTGKYEANFTSPKIWNLVHVEAEAFNSDGQSIDKTYVWLFLWGYDNKTINLIFG